MGPSERHACGPPAREDRWVAGSATERARLLSVRYRRNGDLSARDELVKLFLPLARSLALRYGRSSEPLDDLVQVACLGLVKATDNFDPDRGAAFSSYAVPTILGELRRHFRDSSWALRVPRRLQERALELRRMADDLAEYLGRWPTHRDLAEAAGLSTDEVIEALEAGRCHDAVPLDAARGDGDEASYADAVGEDDGHYELVEYGTAIGPAFESLPEREQMVIRLRFVGDMTQAEIADRIGISQMHVSRLIRRALDEIRSTAAAA